MNRMTLFNVVSAYMTRKKGSMIVVIPKEFVEELGVNQGTKFRVYVDDDGRIIYDRIKRKKEDS